LIFITLPLPEPPFCPDPVLHPSTVLRSPLYLCAYLTTDALIRSLNQFIGGGFTTAPDPGRYTLSLFSQENEFLQFVEQEKQHIDCLILQDDADLPDLMAQLQQHDMLLPALILVESTPSPLVASLSTALDESSPNQPAKASRAVAESDQTVTPSTEFSYHSATLRVSAQQFDQLDQAINQAISKFLKLAAASPPAIANAQLDPVAALTTHNSLMLQQRRLAEKLKERLGYLGVYYKRNPQNFIRHMTQPQRQAFMEQLRADYREIILSYFSPENSLNEKIDNFVNLAFFADIAVAQIVEIHMELMDEFSKQLKLEGRSDEVLLDYRLTLIDTLAHLCEMYRRSIPRES
jgi:circadian clock protein KaiA